MPKVEYEPWEIKLFNETEEGRKYLEYNDRVGGDPIGLMVPFGYPAGVVEMGDEIAVYEECIKRGITWEDLLDFNPPEDAVI